MAITLTELITVQELRDEVGGPTSSTIEIGHMTDTMLQNIIDRFLDSYEQLILSTTRDVLKNSDSYELPFKVDDINIDLVPSGHAALLAHAVIDATYVPYSKRCLDATGNSYAYDKQIDQTIEISPFIRRRFFIDGYDLYVYPRDTEVVTLWLTTLNDSASGLAGRTYNGVYIPTVQELNQKILEYTMLVLQNRITEGDRLDKHKLIN